MAGLWRFPLSAALAQGLSFSGLGSAWMGSVCFGSHASWRKQAVGR